ncbi:syntaphilin [Latimeria chalumnae]|uniref:syntaphilin n=1 Tax=Latimeria chalumnae TaxID=7897 RepID=UPI00313D4583
MTPTGEVVPEETPDIEEVTGDITDGKKEESVTKNIPVVKGNAGEAAFSILQGASAVESAEKNVKTRKSNVKREIVKLTSANGSAYGKDILGVVVSHYAEFFKRKDNCSKKEIGAFFDKTKVLMEKYEESNLCSPITVGEINGAIDELLNGKSPGWSAALEQRDTDDGCQWPAVFLQACRSRKAPAELPCHCQQVEDLPPALEEAWGVLQVGKTRGLGCAAGWQAGSCRSFCGRRGLSSFFKSTRPPASQTEIQPLLATSRRPSPPVSFRDSYGTSSVSSSSNSGSCKGSDGSPTPRRHIKYASCSDNHGIKPPTPEQYLTPLQQKEVCIRHLRAQLKDTLDKLQDRDTEIEDLKTQLARMQEDWIEEECHRVEAQLALKEARKEIQRLKQVIDTVKNNLVEKDKGIQKYFNDINLQNKKLENLLQSMEMAQNGAMRDEGAAESAGGSPARSLTRSSTYTKLSDQAIMADKNTGDLQNNSAEETNTADSGFVAAEDSMSRTDLLEHSLLSSALEISGGLEMALQMPCLAATRLSRSSTCEKLGNFSMDAGVQASDFKEQAIQTDYVQYCPELDTIMEKVLRSHAGSPSSPTSVWLSEGEELGSNLENQTQIFGKTLDLVPSDPNSAILVTDTEGVETLANPHGSLSTHNPTVCQPAPASQAESTVCDLDEDTGEAAQETSLRKSYWSRHFIIDLLAVAVPVVPTVAWLCRSQRREGQPVYNISSLLRGCCTVALHSIRKMSGRSVGDDNNGASNA